MPPGSVTQSNPYGTALSSNPEPFLHEVCEDEAALVSAFVQVLKGLPAPVPDGPVQITNAIQGNLAELLVYDLGLNHWKFVERKFSWVANALSPWKESSDPGLDVLALAPTAYDRFFVVEVKSSVKTGTSSVHSKESSLRNDFEKLFSGKKNGRLPCRVAEAVWDLRYKLDKEELVGPLLQGIGVTPKTSPAVSLVGVIVCSQGVHREENAQRRNQAFKELKEMLVTAGWSEEQISLRAVELKDLKTFLRKVVDEVAP